MWGGGPGKSAPTSCSVEGRNCFFPSPGTCGVLLRKVNGTAIIQLPSKRQMQVCGGLRGECRWEGSVQEEFLECTLPVQDSSQVFYVGKCLEVGLSFSAIGVPHQAGSREQCLSFSTTVRPAFGFSYVVLFPYLLPFSL